MNINKHKFHFHKLLTKLCIITILICMFLFLAVSVIANVVLFNLNRYKNEIEQLVAEKTDYLLKIGSITTDSTYDYLPELIFKNTSFSSKNDPTHILAFKEIDLSISYRSLLVFSLIFNKIKIDNTQLDVTYDKNDNLYLNGMPLTSNLKNKQSSNFDIEKWLLKQKEIILSNVDFSVLDDKNNLKKIILHNININYLNNIFNTSKLKVTVDDHNDKNHIFANLKWDGKKFEDYKNWEFAHFQLKTYSNNPSFYRDIQQYLPNLGLIDQYKAKTAVEAKIKNGILNYFNADFSVNNLSYAFINNKNSINFPNISGKINITLNSDKNTYNINAESLDISTSKGSLINNKKITGYYAINKHGEIYIDNSSLNGINNLLSIIPKAKGISVNGKLDYTKISWDGSIFKPKNYLINVAFESINLITQGTTIPTISNISGILNATRESGEISVKIESTAFVYKQLFYIPYRINHLSSKVNWKINKDQSVLIKLESTLINASDFNAIARGKYIYIPGTTGYLELYANLDKIPANRVGYYLPKVIDSSNQWLQGALLDGYGKNATFTLTGWLKDFPFEKGNGKFYIDADIDNGRLAYVNKWPTIYNTYGKFMIKNQKIIITANKAKISKNNINNAEVIIPNMLDSNPYLIANGQASGSTQNFIDYLKRTPINQLVGRLPDQTIAKGNGKVKLQLKIPFSNPEHTSVKGTYTFSNNTLQFNDLPVPTIEFVNGNLDFTNKGVTINSLVGRSLGGKINISAYTTKKGDIHFSAITESTNYKKLAQLYTPWLSEIISGKANTNVDFTVNKLGVQSAKAYANMDSIAINAPPPINKQPGKNSIFNFNLKRLSKDGYSIYLSYESALYSSLSLDNHGKLTTANVRIGDNTQLTEHLPSNAKISMNLDYFNIMEWISLINTLSIFSINKKSTSKIKAVGPKSSYQLTTGAPNKNSIFPIDIALHTQNFNVNTIKFGNAHGEMYITDDVIAFNMTSRFMDGYGVYQIPPNQLNLTLYFINLRNKNYSVQNNNDTNSVDHTTPEAVSEKISESIVEALLESNEKQAKNYSHLTNKVLNTPNTNVQIKQIYYKGNDIGKISAQIKPDHNNLVIESLLWDNKNATYNFNVVNYCFLCDKIHSLVNINFETKYNDLGRVLSSLHYDNILSQTSGSAKGRIQYQGKINDFSLKSIIGKIDIKLKNGRFLKVDTGTLIGSIIGIINLQTIANLVSFNFKYIFANGFAFNTLEAKAYIINHVLHLKYFYMSSTMAIVGLKGVINLSNNLIDMYLNVTPNLGVGVAVGAGIITFNPLIGVATYITEIALQNPINKLFAFTFHLTGLIKKPTIKQIGVSKQITENLNSTVGR